MIASVDSIIIARIRESKMHIKFQILIHVNMSKLKLKLPLTDLKI